MEKKKTPPSNPTCNHVYSLLPTLTRNSKMLLGFRQVFQRAATELVHCKTVLQICPQVVQIFLHSQTVKAQVVQCAVASEVCVLKVKS